MLQYSLTSSAKVRIFIQRLRAPSKHARMRDRNMFKIDHKDNVSKSGLIVISVSRIYPGRMYRWEAKIAQERPMTRQMLLWSKSWVCILYYRNCHFSFHLARCPRLSPHTPRPYHCSCYSNTERIPVAETMMTRKMIARKTMTRTSAKKQKAMRTAMRMAASTRKMVSPMMREIMALKQQPRNITKATVQKA